MWTRARPSPGPTLVRTKWKPSRVKVRDDGQAASGDCEQGDKMEVIALGMISRFHSLRLNDL